jgi:transposase-like protein
MRTHGSTISTKAVGFRRLAVITGVGRRRRWTEEDKARIAAESLDPATTASAVARRYGLHVSQLFTWRQQLAAPAGIISRSDRMQYSEANALLIIDGYLGSAKGIFSWGGGP